MADVLDVISLTAAKAAINMASGNTDHDTELARQITAVSRIIDDMCGPVVVRTITAEEHAGGTGIVSLRRYPVDTITTVREVDHAGGLATLTAVAFGATTDGYRAFAWEKDPTLLSGLLARRRYGCNSRWGREVEVTYVAGRFANTAAVDARFVEAAASILRRLWKRESGTWAQAASVFEESLDQPTSGFFRAVKPLVEELLFDEVQTHLAAFA